MSSGSANSEPFDGLLGLPQSGLPAPSDLAPLIDGNISTVENEDPGTLPLRAVTGQGGGNLARRRFQNGQLLLLKKRWSVRSCEDVIEHGERRRKRVQRFLGTLAEFPTKRACCASDESRARAINGLAYRPRSTTTFREFAEQ